MVDTFERVCHEAGLPGSIYRVRSDVGVSERRLSYGKRELAKERYADRASELVMNVVECVMQRAIYGIDGDVAAQLYTRGIDEGSLDGGRMKVEKKKDWRQKNEDRSPDELDALACAIAMLLERKVLILGKDTRPRDAVDEGLEDWMRRREPTGNRTIERRRRASRLVGR